MAKLQLEVVTTTEVLWHGDAHQVSVPGVEGYIGILPGRQPVLSLLKAGDINIVDMNGNTKTVPIEHGFVSVDQDHVIVCIENMQETTN